MKLTDVSTRTKLIVNLLIAFIVIYYTGIFILIPIGVRIRNSIFPPKDLPNTIFGPLDPITFNKKQVLGNNPTYTLNTKGGQLPVGFPLNAPVLQVIPVPFSYDAGKNAQKYATALGFLDTDRISDLNSEVYKWRSKDSQGLLEIPIGKRQIILNTYLTNRATVFTESGLNEENATTHAKDLFRDIDMFEDPLYIGGTQTVYLGKFSGIQVVAATNTNEATLARVEFFRKAGEFPIYGPDPKKGLLSVTLRTPSTTQPYYNYPIIEAYYNEVNKDATNATYPIIPVSVAWQQVSTGKGVIANVTPKNSNPFEEYKPVRVDSIIVNDISLAMYEQPESPTYIQPIYVFKGNFTAAGGANGEITLYFPAISSEWIKQPAAPVTTPQQ